MPRRLAVAVLAVLALVPSLPAFAQGPVTITGLVTTREDGLPLPGATVSIESLNVSATTDAEGRYRLEVPASARRPGGRPQGQLRRPQPARDADPAAPAA